MPNALHFFFQVLVLFVCAPLLSGIITKIKNNLRFRRGPSIFQPYFNLLKYFSKDEVVSVHASWIFKITPYIVITSTTTALLMLPVLFYGRPLIFMGDFLVIIFLLSLGRFFLILAGLDPATTFGGMGSSREMFIASFVEPVAMLAIFAIALVAGSTNLQTIAQTSTINTSTIMASVALFLVALAETSRIPVDNQETHLELTMIHEAMLLEYSGRSLGLLELAAHLKQILFLGIISLVAFPAFVGIQFFILKILLLCLIMALTELSMAKMRLFRAVDFIAFAGILSIMAIIALALGV
ncbi:MAG: NADH-quinone oxidoreductase subunit H [Patescibacteria group bacterium]